MQSTSPNFEQNIELPQNAISLVKHYLLELQHKICTTLESIDSHSSFQHDRWSTQPNEGVTSVLTAGKTFAKVGVNFSHVRGQNLPATANKTRSFLQGYNFNALGVSVITHPENPFVPTAHLNVRFFIAQKPNHPTIWWFGGGFDLTPVYGFREDCVHWHQMAAAACKPFGKDLYPELKDYCDRYFYLPHRQESRGIGGIFFDDFYALGFEKSFAFMQNVGNHFMQAYYPIVIKRKNLPYTPQQKSFQLFRRGRYVEFNLLYDRGTLFGLQSNGRIESILISMPPEVTWHYQFTPVVNSLEEQLYTNFLHVQNWIAS